MTKYETIQVDRSDRVVTIRLDRPKALNALNSQMLEEVPDAALPLDGDPEIGCFIITGSERAFAAGADIAELNAQDHMAMYHSDFFAGCLKPLVMLARECVAMAEETGLAEGINFERRIYHAIFGTDDKTEGMTAFLEKREPGSRDDRRAPPRCSGLAAGLLRDVAGIAGCVGLTLLRDNRLGLN